MLRRRGRGSGRTAPRSGELEEQESEQNQVKTRYAAERLVLTAGNVSVLDVFDALDYSRWLAEQVGKRNRHPRLPDPGRPEYGEDLHALLIGLRRRLNEG